MSAPLGHHQVERMREMLLAGYSDREVAMSIGCTPRAVRSRRSAWGIELGRPDGHGHWFDLDLICVRCGMTYPVEGEWKREEWVLCEGRDDG